jgi:CHAD domain-containing protein
VKARKVKGLDPSGNLAENALRIVEVRLAEVCDLAGAALDPSAVEARHDMRIAAKRLRYALETTGPAFGRAASDGARTARALQDVLGEIHDCDVMLPRVRAHAARLREDDAEALRREAGGRARDLEPASARSAPNLDRYRGIEALLSYLEARRRVLFDRFSREWERLERRGFADALVASLRTGLPVPGGPTDAGAP